MASDLRPYGITNKNYFDLLEKQNGVCKLCKSPPGVNPRQKRLCIDHDHVTNIVRGLLCDKCNRVLGMLGDTVESIKSVLIYVSGGCDVIIGESKKPDILNEDENQLSFSFMS